MKMPLLDRLCGPLLVQAADPVEPTKPATPVSPAAPPVDLGVPAPPVDPTDLAPTPDPAALGALPAPGEEPLEDPLGDEEKPEEEKESPVVNWQNHLQDVANDIKGTLQVPITLMPEEGQIVPVGNDPDLGYHIVGLVHFTDGVPPDIKEKLKGRSLKYSAYVSPDGELGTSVDLFFTTTDPYEAGETPTYHVDSNQYRIVS